MRWTVLRRFAISCLAVMIVLPATARTRPHYGGTLHVEIEGDPWQHPDGIARRLVYDGLTSLGSKGAVEPALAISWESDVSDHRWQFSLRQGVHFHDGSQLTSAAVAASLIASCGSNCPWTAVRAVGLSVVFTGDSPMPNLPTLLADERFLIVLAVTEEGKTPTGAIGTGPFQLTGFSNGVLALSANENSWQGRPFADGVEIRVHRSIRDQWLDLSVGRADVVEIPAEQIRQAQQQRLTAISLSPASLLALQLANTGVLSNLKLREAIGMAVDRGALYNVIFQKQGEVTASLLPQSVTGYSFLFPVDRDLNKAHELRGGQSPALLTLSVEGNGAMQLAAQRIALNLREAGLNVQVVEASRQYADLILRRIPIEGGEPAAMLESMLHNAGEVDPVLDKSPVALLKREKDFLDQKKLIPLLALPKAYAVSGRVRDFKIQMGGTPDLAGSSLEDGR
jgi:peptide/nickel transport system substrate-binding protein